MTRMVLTTAVGFILTATLLAQRAPDDALTFEVASIKPQLDTGNTQTGFEENESLVRINLPLRMIIGIAYSVPGPRVVGPAWLDRRAFSIHAKPPAGYQRAQLPILVRNLLADRFKLIAHSEQREVQGYALRAANGGPTLTRSTGPKTYLTGRAGLISGNGRTIAELVPLLGQMVGTRVVDETGLTGTFDLKLEWTARLAAPNVGSTAEPDLSIFTALREQLGLQLAPIRTTIDVVVIDSVSESPTPN
jgi:uncharacterized protein (TIGR03435 family)